uniref:Uncharacterized protein n=2 Tax=Anguilla anguilla TaxID=7936 RepID=A0A0E9TD99_ANGAN
MTKTRTQFSGVSIVTKDDVRWWCFIFFISQFLKYCFLS